MERLRRILFLTASIGSAAQAQQTQSQGYKDFQARRDAALANIRQTSARLNGKPMDPQTLLNELKRRMGAGSPLAQRLAKNPELEKHFLSLLESAKENGWGDIRSLIEGDELLKSQLGDLLAEGDFSDVLQDAVNRVFKDATQAEKAASYSGGFGGGGGGGSGGGGAGGGSKSGAPQDASGTEARLTPELTDNEGGESQSDNGSAVSVTPTSPTTVAAAEPPPADTPASKLGGSNNFGNYGGGSGAGSSGPANLANRGASLSGAGNGGNAASDMTGDQGQGKPQDNQQQGQQAGGNQPTGGTGTNTPSGDHGAGGSGRSLVSGNTKAPKDTAAQPTQQAAAAPKKPVDPDIALVQKPFYESLLKEYQKSPRTTDKAKIAEIQEKLKDYDAAIKKKYPKLRNGEDACSLLRAKYQKPEIIEHFLSDIGFERQEEIKKLQIQKLTVDDVVSAKWTTNPEIKQYMANMSKARPIVECIAKAKWDCVTVQKECGTDYAIANAGMCYEIGSTYQNNIYNNEPMRSADPFQKCFQITDKSVQKAAMTMQCRALACKKNPALAMLLYKGEENVRQATLFEKYSEFRFNPWPQVLDGYKGSCPKDASECDDKTNLYFFGQLRFKGEKAPNDSIDHSDSRGHTE